MGDGTVSRSALTSVLHGRRRRRNRFRVASLTRSARHKMPKKWNIWHRRYSTLFNCFCREFNVKKENLFINATQLHLNIKDARPLGAVSQGRVGILCISRKEMKSTVPYGEDGRFEFRQPLSFPKGGPAVSNETLTACSPWIRSLGGQARRTIDNTGYPTWW